MTSSDYAVLRDVAAAGHVSVLADRDSKDWRRTGTAEIVRAATPARP